MADAILPQWKDIPNTGGLYQASTDGEVRSIDRYLVVPNRWGTTTTRKLKGKTLKPWVDSNDYLVVYICADGKREAVNVHRLIAITFLGAPDGTKDVNHKDANKKNNRPDNLEWCTRKENMSHAVKAGLLKFIKAVKATPINGGEPLYFKSASDAGRSLGIQRGNISSAACGKLKTAYGYKWEFQ
jgi:hypothetical protein